MSVAQDNGNGRDAAPAGPESVARARGERTPAGGPDLLLLEFLGEWQTDDGTQLYPQELLELERAAERQDRRGD